MPAQQQQQQLGATVHLRLRRQPAKAVAAAAAAKSMTLQELAAQLLLVHKACFQDADSTSSTGAFEGLFKLARLAPRLFDSDAFGHCELAAIAMKHSNDSAADDSQGACLHLLSPPLPVLTALPFPCRRGNAVL